MYFIKDVLLIESVQRKFTKRIPGFNSLSYGERLKTLNMISLERRRLETDLTMCFKILNGLVSGPPESYGLNISNRQSRGHSFKLIIEQPKVDVRKFFFANRVAKPWNALPQSVVDSNSIGQFKRRLREINLQNYLYIKV